ncbi:MAG: hypothetical protein ACJ72Z_12540, partial [Pyrinomonadaceae bacterium]
NLWFGRTFARSSMFLISAYSVCVALIAGSMACQQVKEDWKYCTKHDVPAFWQPYGLPRVEGSQVCSDYPGTTGKERIYMIHYNDGDNAGKDIFDYINPYTEAFNLNGWTIEQPFHDEYSAGFYSRKNGAIFSLVITDCYSGQKTYLSRPCSKIELAREEKIPEKKNKSGT